MSLYISEQMDYLRNYTGSVTIGGQLTLTYPITGSGQWTQSAAAISRQGNVEITGSLNVDGNIVAQEYHMEIISSSIIYQSGSTLFGNSTDDTHTFTGSVNVSNGVTASLFGTAATASFATTAYWTQSNDGVITRNSNVTTTGSFSVSGSVETDGVNFHMNTTESLLVPPSASGLDVIFPLATTGSLYLVDSGSDSYVVYKDSRGWWRYLSGSTAIR
ncbi:MAG TPA: hypothetical protein DC057_05190 [Spirochaetia bacterium]|nr:hypothetical protein [Spirochaetia bacterium]